MNFISTKTYTYTDYPKKNIDEKMQKGKCLLGPGGQENRLIVMICFTGCAHGGRVLPYRKACTIQTISLS